MQARHRTRVIVKRGVERGIIGAALVALPLPALAALDPWLPRWAAYAFFAIVAMVVIVLLLHEVLDEEGAEAQRELRESAPEAHGKRYAAQRGTDKIATSRRPA